MTTSICGINCNECPMNSSCNGCTESCGKPFGKKCIVAKCFESGENAYIELKSKILEQINSLGIDDMGTINDLYSLKGSFINIEYTMPNGEKVKFFDDDTIYLGNQIEKKNSDRCYGVAGNDEFLLISEYGENGSNPELILFKYWNKK